MAYIVVKKVETKEDDELLAELLTKRGCHPDSYAVFEMAFGRVNLNLINDPARVKDWLDRANAALEDDPALPEDD